MGSVCSHANTCFLDGESMQRCTNTHREIKEYSLVITTIGREGVRAAPALCLKDAVKKEREAGRVQYIRLKVLV